jgi:hypothetical protein
VFLLQLLDGKAYQMVKDMHIAQYVLSDEMVAQLLALVSVLIMIVAWCW